MQNQRTFSQQFDKNHFLDVKDVNFINDERTLNVRDKNGLISANSSFVNFTIGKNSIGDN